MVTNRRRMGTINSLIDELNKLTDKMSGNDMSEMANLCCNATITILKLQNDVELLRKMWHQARLEAQSFKAENDRLREDLAFEHSENSWMYEFLDHMGQKCGTKDCLSLVDYVGKLETENTKLRTLIGLKEVCWKYVGWCEECPFNGMDDEHDDCNCTVQEKINLLARELGMDMWLHNYCPIAKTRKDDKCHVEDVIDRMHKLGIEVE